MEGIGDGSEKSLWVSIVVFQWEVLGYDVVLFDKE